MKAEPVAALHGRKRAALRVRRHRRVQGRRPRAPPARRRRDRAGRDDGERAALRRRADLPGLSGLPVRTLAVGRSRRSRRWATSNSRAGPTPSSSPPPPPTCSPSSRTDSPTTWSARCAWPPLRRSRVAPAMNHRMWLHAATQANVALLRERGAQLRRPRRRPAGRRRIRPRPHVRAARHRRRAREGHRLSLAGVRVRGQRGPDLRGPRPGPVPRQPQQREDGLRDRRRRRATRCRHGARRRPRAPADTRGRARASTCARAAQMHEAVLDALPADVYVGAAAVADFTPARSSPRRSRKCRARTRSCSTGAHARHPRRRRARCAAAARWWSASPRKPTTSRLRARQARRQAHRHDRGQPRRPGRQRLRERRQRADRLRRDGDAVALGPAPKTALADALLDLRGGSDCTHDATRLEVKVLDPRFGDEWPMPAYATERQRRPGPARRAGGAAGARAGRHRADPLGPGDPSRRPDAVRASSCRARAWATGTASCSATAPA